MGETALRATKDSTVAGRLLAKKMKMFFFKKNATKKQLSPKDPKATWIEQPTFSFQIVEPLAASKRS